MTCARAGPHAVIGAGCAGAASYLLSAVEHLSRSTVRRVAAQAASAIGAAAAIAAVAA